MLAVSAERLFDGDEYVERPVLLLDGHRIVAVGEAVPESVEVLDLPGATLLPGLIDCHQHLCFDGHGSLEEQVAGVTDDALVARCRAGAARALQAGVTTIRDVGDRGYLSLGLRDDPELPTILASGPPVTRVQGHCWYLGGECEPEEAALRAAVRERAERGCDLVKVMVTGGVLTPNFPIHASQFGLADLRLLVDEAHAHGLPVAAHCHGTQGIADAFDAGVDTIEHCSFASPDMRSVPDEALMARLGAAGAVVCADAGRVGDHQPPRIIQENLGTIRRAHTRLHELGATVILGSDAGIAPGKPHDVLPFGLWEVAGFGTPARDLLRGCTSAAADALGLGGRTGRLTAGHDADVLAVAGDPIADLTSLAATLAVWKAGRRIR